MLVTVLVLERKLVRREKCRKNAGAQGEKLVKRPLQLAGRERVWLHAVQRMLWCTKGWEDVHGRGRKERRRR